MISLAGRDILHSLEKFIFTGIGCDYYRILAGAICNNMEIFCF